MEPNKKIDSRLPIHRPMLWSTMIDPRRTTSTFGDSAPKRANTRMSLTSMKTNTRTVTHMSTDIRTLSRLGSHPYLSATVRPTLRKGVDLNVATKQVVTQVVTPHHLDSHQKEPQLSQSPQPSPQSLQLSKPPQLSELPEVLQSPDLSPEPSQPPEPIQASQPSQLPEPIEPPEVSQPPQPPQPETSKNSIPEENENIKYRIIHFNQNPISDEFVKQRIELKRLSEENQRLAAKLELLENGCDADITRQLDEGIKSRHEVETLKQKLDSAEKRQKKIIDEFKRTSKEFREVCWNLLGFRIDMLKQNNTYRLSNIYSDSPEDCLMFEFGSNQTIKLLENEYSRRLSSSEDLTIYLREHNSYPAFLASLTLELFRKQTIV